MFVVMIRGILLFTLNLSLYASEGREGWEEENGFCPMRHFLVAETKDNKVPL